MEVKWAFRHLQKFFAAQIQIPIPNKYLGFGYKDLVFSRNNNNNIFAIVQSTVSDLLKDSNTTVAVKNLLRWGSNRQPLVYKAGVFTIPPRNQSLTNEKH